MEKVELISNLEFIYKNIGLGYELSNLQIENKDVTIDYVNEIRNSLLNEGLDEEKIENIQINAFDAGESDAICEN